MLEGLRGRVVRRLSSASWLPIVDATDKRKIAITFDDGPSPQATPRILELLDRRSVHATFFLLGQRSERWPELVRDIVQAGHKVYAHGYSHIRLDEASPHTFFAELDRAEAALSLARPTPTPYLVRLPYGSGHHCSRVHRLLRAWRPDCQLVHWRYDMKDFLLAQDCMSEQELYARCQAKVSEALTCRRFAGSIILMHEDPFDAEAPMASLVGPLLLEQLLLGAASAGLGMTHVQPRRRGLTRSRKRVSTEGGR